MIERCKNARFALTILAAIASALVALMVLIMPAKAYAADMYRMYNPNSGEHFYTADVAERNNLYIAGWDYEGII